MFSLPSICRRRELPATLLVIVLTVASNSANAATGEQYFQDALDRYRQGEFAAAAIQLKNLIELDPNRIDARLLMANTKLKLNAPRSALDELEIAAKLGAPAAQVLLLRMRVLSELQQHATILELEAPEGLTGPGLGEWHYLRGLAYLETGDNNQSLEAFTRARDHVPSSGEAIAGLVIANLRLGNADNAQELLSEADRIAPNSSEVLQAHAAIAESEGRVDDAIAAYDRALETDARNRLLRLKRANALISTRRFADAEQALAPLAKEIPFAPKVHFMHARALHALDRHDDAKAAIGRAGDLVGSIPADKLRNDPPYLLLAGSIKYFNGEYNAAWDYLNTFLGIEPTHLLARKMLASTLIRLGQPLDAVASLRTLTSRGLADAYVYALLGEAYNAAGMHADAVKALELASLRGNASADVLSILGINRLAQGQTESGIAALEAAIEQDAEALKPRLYLAALRLRRGETDKAHAVIGEFLERHPDHLVGLNFKVMLHASEGELDKAREINQRILDIRTDFRPAHINMAKLDSQIGDHSAARERLAHLLLETPQDIALMREMARVERTAGRDDVALEWLRRAQSIQPEDVDIGRALIQLLIDMNQPQQALSTALSLKSNNPQNLAVLETLATTQLAIDDAESARITLRSMSGLAVGATDSLKRIASLSLRAGDRTNALNALTKAVAQEQDNPTLRTDLARLLLAMGKVHEAHAQARILSQQYPESSSGPLLLAELALREGRYEEALVLYDEIPAAGRSAEVAIKRFHAWSKLGNMQRGIDELGAWIEKHPEHYRPRRTLATALHFSGAIDKARPRYEALLAENPSDVVVLLNLSLLYRQSNDPRALQMAFRAYQARPDYPPALDALGSLYIQIGQPTKGLQLLREALYINPEDGDIRYHLALGLEAVGRRNEAIKALRTALEQPKMKERHKAEKLLQKMELAESQK